MRRWMILVLAVILVSLITATAGATTGAEVSDEPDFLPGVCHLFTSDEDSELIWLFAIHDPASGCTEFALDGREIDIENLGEGLLWNVLGFHEGDVIQLDGVVDSLVFGFDSAAVDSGTPITSFIHSDYLIAAGQINVNLSIVGTQADGDGIKVTQLNVRGLGTLTTVGGAKARFTAAVHEEVEAILPGVTPTKVLSQISLRVRG